MADTIVRFLEKSRQLDALVGYFYFSGFQSVYKNLRNKKVRILVGMEIDKKILEKISTIDFSKINDYLVSSNSEARSSVWQDYIESLATIFNNTDEFDNKESIEAFELFLSKIKDGSLEIKKTAEPNHSKVYIFHFDEEFTKNGQEPGVIIEGSSNFTFSGLEGQHERNRILKEKHYYEDDANNFEQLWNNPDNIELVNIESADSFIEEIKKRIWLYQLPSPELLYYRVLEEFYSIDEVEGVKMPSEITGGKFTDLRYQRDAIERGIDRINRFGGVIVADVVGLGKSIIASTIAHNLNLQTVIIAPPHLKSQWEDYIADFDFKAQVYTTGKIEEALRQYGQQNRKLLIILDEAHKHRNEDTESYKMLHRLCAGNNVMALSATPFNNDPKDIYALIKLFTTPGKSTIKTVENLSIAFNELFVKYKKSRRKLRDANTKTEVRDIEQEMQQVAERLRMMISPLVIRRSRLDLKEIDDYCEDLQAQGIEFADVEEPGALEYSLGSLSDLYLDTLEIISPETETPSKKHFNGVRYKPASYLKENSEVIKKLIADSDTDDEEKSESAKQKLQQITQAQVNVAKFMRRLLVRRFESSVEAFRSSLSNMIDSAELMLDWYYNRKEVPIYKKANLPDTKTLKELYAEDSKEFDKLIDKLEGRGLIRIPTSEIKKSFCEDLENDIRILKEIQQQWENVNDPKLKYFVENIKTFIEENPKRKIIVFTEFADTAGYVFAQLKEQHKDLRVFKYTAADSNKQNKQIIRENFDAGLDKKSQKDDYDILIATDAISEGFNLHRAGIVINYDIPYNPTRVIQRVGRINRINKKIFDRLYIYNFFPTFTGEQETKSKTIAVFKKKIIDAVLGDDTKIFTSDEELQNFFAEEYKKAKAKIDGTSWDAKYYNNWHNLRRNPKLLEQVRQIPHRVRIARKSDFAGTLVFARRNNNTVFAFGETPETAKIISPEQALPMFNGEHITEEKSSETTANFDPIYKVAKEHIFKENTLAKVKTSKNRKEALDKMKLLAKFPPARNYAQDVQKIIAEFDALPVATLKEISNTKIGDKPQEAFEKIREILPIDYIEKIMQTASRADNAGKLVLLSEEFIKE